METVKRLSNQPATASHAKGQPVKVISDHNPGTIDRQTRWIALLTVTALTLYLCWLMLKPFVSVLAWAGVLVIAFYPVHRLLKTRIKRPGLCAALSSVLVIAALLIPLLLISAAVVGELAGVANDFQRNVVITDPNSLVGRAVEWLQGHFGLSESRSQQFIAESLKSLSGYLAGRTVGFVGGTIGIVFQAFLVIATIYYLFRDADQIVTALRQFLPLEDAQSDAMFARAREVIGASLYGVVTVATVQGTLGGLAFWVLGLPSALLWGVLITFLCMIPMAGSWLVWVPATVYLAATGHWTRAIIMFLWGLLVVGTIDNFLRPRLVGRRGRLHELLVFFSVLGGLRLFGLLGIVLGPVVLALAIALLTATKVPQLSPRTENS